MQQPPRKKSLVICKLYSYWTRPQEVIQKWTPNLLSTVNWCFATWAREETRNSIFCKPLKQLSPCRLFSLFTFAPRPAFHVARATAYQAVYYIAEIMQLHDTMWQSKHKRRKNVILWTPPFRTNFVKEWFLLISGINIALLYPEPDLADAMTLG